MNNERIGCPITLGEYERVVRKYKLYEYKVNVYDLLVDNKKLWIQGLCEKLNINIENCHFTFDEFKRLVLTTVEHRIVLPITINDLKM